MAETELSIKDLLALAAGGAKIRTEQRPTFIAQVDPSVEQFDALLGKLDAIVKTNEARVVADMANAEMQLKLIATLEAAIKSVGVTKSQPLDLAPLKTMLTEMQGSRPKSTKAVTKRHPAYDFAFERSKQSGFVEKIVVTPRV